MLCPWLRTSSNAFHQPLRKLRCQEGKVAVASRSKVCLAFLVGVVKEHLPLSKAKVLLSKGIACRTPGTRHVRQQTRQLVSHPKTDDSVVVTATVCENRNRL